VNATQLANGTSGRVIRLNGSGHFAEKLAAMGITPGTVICKKSDSILRGPIVIEKGPVQIAIGYGMAQRIIVEPLIR
jgi:ferrous iron transport protein A